MSTFYSTLYVLFRGKRLYLCGQLLAVRVVSLSRIVPALAADPAHLVPVSCTDRARAN